MVDPLGLSCGGITNKYPNENMPLDGKITSFSIIDGKIKGINGQRHFDFIVDMNGKLVIGNKHHLLGQGQQVLAAGQIRLNGQDQIRHIDNLSGYYRPNVSEASNFPKILQDAGVDVKGVIMDVYQISTSGGYVSGMTKVSTMVL